MSYIKDFYGRTHAEEPILKAKELHRIQSTLSLIPEDVGFILDLGCGDGRITGLLASKFRVVGADFTVSSLKKLSHPKACVDIDHLAFKENSFDLVMLTEVLEHLPDAVYRQAIEEVRKVSKKYILITVPYREILRSNFIKCNKCKTVFHLWYHCRCFKSKKDLANIFPGYVPVRYGFFGKERTYQNNLLLKIKQDWGHRWPKTGKSTICPQCGSQEFDEGQRNLISLACSGLERIMQKIVPKFHKRWVGVLYVKS